MAGTSATFYDPSAMKADGVTYDPGSDLGSSAYSYRYNFGDFLSGGMAAGKQAEAQAAMDTKEWLRNEASAKAQRDFELWLDSTKTQRAMKDIEAAGLNPWLALQSAGFGGSVPSGAAASSNAGQAAAGDSGARSMGTMMASAAGIAAMIKLVSKFLK